MLLQDILFSVTPPWCLSFSTCWWASWCFVVQLMFLEILLSPSPDWCFSSLRSCATRLQQSNGSPTETASRHLGLIRITSSMIYFRTPAWLVHSEHSNSFQYERGSFWWLLFHRKGGGGERSEMVFFFGLTSHKPRLLTGACRTFFFFLNIRCACVVNTDTLVLL